jgi:hypothetical protein
MERERNTGPIDEAGDASYDLRGDDNLEDMTRYDENAMDRSAQAGNSGAFGAGDQDHARETTLDDAIDAFGGDTGGVDLSDRDTRSSGGDTAMGAGSAGGGGVDLGPGTPGR